MKTALLIIYAIGVLVADYMMCKSAHEGLKRIRNKKAIDTILWYLICLFLGLCSWVVVIFALLEKGKYNKTK